MSSDLTKIKFSWRTLFLCRSKEKILRSRCEDRIGHEIDLINFVKHQMVSKIIFRRLTTKSEREKMRKQGKFIVEKSDEEIEDP